MTHDREDEYRWELPAPVLSAWRSALAPDGTDQAQAPSPVVPYTPAA